MSMQASILVVEDNPRNLRLFRDLLELVGHDVTVAQSVEEGRIRIREKPLALIVMDIKIPGGGGELLLQEIRQDPELATIPVIAVTAFAMAGDRERLLKAGFDGYMSKPIDTRSFAPTIETFLRASEHGA